MLPEHGKLKQPSPQPDQKPLRDVNDERFPPKRKVKSNMGLLLSRQPCDQKCQKAKVLNTFFVSQISLVRSAFRLSVHHGGCGLLGVVATVPPPPGGEQSRLVVSCALQPWAFSTSLERGQDLYKKVWLGKFQVTWKISPAFQCSHSYVVFCSGFSRSYSLE